MRHGKNILYYYLILLLPFFTILVVTQLNFEPKWDEASFHIKGIQQFRNSLPEINLTEYHSATTPLFHIILGFITKLFGFEIWKMRFFNLFFGYLASIVFFNIMKEHEYKFPLHSTLLFIFYPYFLVLSSLIMTETLGLFFAMLSLKFYLRDDNQRNLLLGSLFAILAIWTRQFWLLLPGGMGLYFIFRHKLKIINARNLLNTVIIGLPILSFLPLFLIWNGFSPREGHHVAVNFSQIYFLFLFLGAYFFIYLIVNINKFEKKMIVPYLIMLTGVIFFNISTESHGIICRILQVEASLFSPISIFIELLGFTVIIQCFYNKNINYKLFFLIIAGLIILIMNPLNAERYLIVFSPLFILFLFKNINRNEIIFKYWSYFMVLCSSLYFIFKIIK